MPWLTSWRAPGNVRAMPEVPIVHLACSPRRIVVRQAVTGKKQIFSIVWCVFQASRGVWPVAGEWEIRDP